MSDYGWALTKVLGRIGMAADMTIEDYQDDGEWFRLVPDKMRDGVLFSVLTSQWSSIVFPSDDSFALIHCQAGRENGVWLHYLETDDQRTEYLCGCHQILGW